MLSRSASLSSITIPDGVTQIDCNAFMECTSLSSITIPDSVTEISVEAFLGCTAHNPSPFLIVSLKLVMGLSKDVPR